MNTQIDVWTSIHESYQSTHHEEEHQDKTSSHNHRERPDQVLLVNELISAYFDIESMNVNNINLLYSVFKWYL